MPLGNHAYRGHPDFSPVRDEVKPFPTHHLHVFTTPIYVLSTFLVFPLEYT